MYSYEDRIKAVELYIKYDLSAADTVRELGYPSYKMLVRWYKEYLETGGLHEQYIKRPAYTAAQMKAAVNYYREHGRNISRTVRVLGYPTREALARWIDELAPGERKARIRRSAVVQFSQEQKKDAVIELCVREGSAAAVADRLGASRVSLYKWKKELLAEGDARTMDGFGKPPLNDDRDALLAEVELLKKEIYRKQMELDILNKTAEIIKKDQASIHGNWQTEKKPA
jgi:transposase-like protein